MEYFHRLFGKLYNYFTTRFHTATLWNIEMNSKSWCLQLSMILYTDHHSPVYTQTTIYLAPSLAVVMLLSFLFIFYFLFSIHWMLQDSSHLIVVSKFEYDHSHHWVKSKLQFVLSNSANLSLIKTDHSHYWVKSKL